MARSYRERTIPFKAGDGMDLNVINVRGEVEPTRGPVLLVHGAGVRANIFRAPVDENIVDSLVAEGYDVWLENWRASIEHPRNEWDLDLAAEHDHPRAVQTVCEEAGSQTCKAIIHCQGSTSFMMSAVAGLVPQVTTILSNAVSLHPVVPPLSAVKLNVAVPLVKQITPYVSPHWGIEASGLFQKSIVGLVELFHPEPTNTVDKMVSFTYGAGNPALWRLENLNSETLDWLQYEFKDCPFTFFTQMARCVKARHLVRTRPSDRLPLDYVAEPPKTDARFVFFAGELNRCFLPESQRRTFEYFDRLRPRVHGLHVFPSYSHLDVFMGKNAAKDVFPTMIRELESDPH